MSAPDPAPHHWFSDADALAHGFLAIRLDTDADSARPQGVMLELRGRTYRLDDTCVEVRPGVWEAYGPPGVLFREGEAGWFAAYAPEGHEVHLVTEDSPLCAGALQFRQPPGAPS